MSGIYGFAAQKGISELATMLNRMLGAIQAPGSTTQHKS
jgi:hypothetical protein